MVFSPGRILSMNADGSRLAALSSSPAVREGKPRTSATANRILDVGRGGALASASSIGSTISGFRVRSASKVSGLGVSIGFGCQTLCGPDDVLGDLFGDGSVLSPVDCRFGTVGLGVLFGDGELLSPFHWRLAAGAAAVAEADLDLVFRFVG